MPKKEKRRTDYMYDAGKIARRQAKDNELAQQRAQLFYSEVLEVDEVNALIRIEHSPYLWYPVHSRILPQVGGYVLCGRANKDFVVLFSLPEEPTQYPLAPEDPNDANPNTVYRQELEGGGEQLVMAVRLPSGFYEYQVVSGEPAWQAEYLGGWGTWDVGGSLLSHEFQYVSHIAVDNAGNVLITDIDAGRVQKFTGSGTYIATYTAPTNQPTGITFNRNNGDFYLVAAGTDRVHQYSPGGVLQNTYDGSAIFGQPFGVAHNGNTVVISDITGVGRLVKTNSSMGSATSVSSPALVNAGDVESDGTGYFYVVVQNGDHIKVFDSSLTAQFNITNPAEVDNPASYIESISIDEQGRLYILTVDQVVFVMDRLGEELIGTIDVAAYNLERIKVRGGILYGLSNNLSGFPVNRWRVPYDGTQGPQGVQGPEGPAGPPGQAVGGMMFRMLGNGVSTSGNVDPGSGEYHYNQTFGNAFSGVNTIYIDDVDLDGSPTTALYDEVAGITGSARGYLRIQHVKGDPEDSPDANWWELYRVTGATDYAGYFALSVVPVTTDSGTSTLAGMSTNAQYVSFIRSGGTGATGRRGAGLPGAYQFTFSTTTTDSDPGNGFVRLSNGASQSESTFMYVDNTAADTTGLFDFKLFINSLDSSPKGIVRLESVDNPSKWVEFRLTSYTDATGYFKLGLSLFTLGTGGAFTNGEAVFLSLNPRGQKGDTGPTGATGATGRQGPGVTYYPGHFEDVITEDFISFGSVRFNNAAASAATAIIMYDIGEDMYNYTAFLEKWGQGTSAVKGRLRVEAVDNPELFHEFDVLGSEFIETVYDHWKIYVDWVDGAASEFDLGDGVYVSFLPTGDQGDKGAGVSYYNGRFDDYTSWSLIGNGTIGAPTGNLQSTTEVWFADYDINAVQRGTLLSNWASGSSATKGILRIESIDESAWVEYAVTGLTISGWAPESEVFYSYRFAVTVLSSSFANFTDLQLVRATFIPKGDKGDVGPPGSSGLPAGSVLPFAGSSAPSGFLLADGTAVDRTTYSALFTAIGTTYGAGNGTTTFNLPNLKGRIPVGLDAAQTEFDALAETGGAKEVTLTAAQSGVPAHTHGPGTYKTTVNAPSNSPTSGSATRLSTGANVDLAVEGTSSANTPASAASAHTNLQPYIVLNYIIAY